ncbi:MAG: replicative DNA helicase [Thermoleophilia bacterium]|jgi:replicative DNA helicase|nr:replicative DNA helicase [Thermoleophilia bacterium]
MPPAPEGANLPPQDLDAEEAVLGAMMINEQAVLTVSDVIRDPGDFYREAHGTVFRAILALLTRSEPIDAVTVSDELERMGKLEDVGGRGFIFGLSSSVTVAANAKSHAQIVRDVAIMRRVAAAGLEIAQLGYQRQGDVRQILDQAESAIFDVAQSRNTSELIPLSELLPEEVERMEAAGEHRGLTGAPSGLNSLDKITSGFQASNLVILAARPAMGKTSLALGIARHLGVEAKIPVVIFSLEMSRNEIAQRFISSEARVDSTRMRRGDLRDEDWVRVQDACNRLTTAPIYVDDTAGINLMEIRSKARRLKIKEPNLGLVLVDYLQLMSANDTAESRVQEISQISRSLKVLARELNIPVLALSQLSRAVESRTDKRPLLSDLRESGCLTGDARVFLPDSGERIRMDQMSGRIGECVLAVNPETWELERRVVTNAFSTGVKPVYRLTLASGRTIRATGNHRFRLLGDWQRLDQLKIGDRLAVPVELRLAAIGTASNEQYADRVLQHSAVSLDGSRHNHGGARRVAGSDELRRLADGQVTWDAVTRIEFAGEEEVFDLTVTGLHNFVAEDIIVHNSIEQDADVVMFIYRDDYYNKETSEKPGTAELIVAKHRNGAVGAVDLAFMPHFTTFSDLARGEA